MSVKTKDDHLYLEANHESKDDEGGASVFQIKRQIPLPEGVKADEVHLHTYHHYPLIIVLYPFIIRKYIR